MLGYKVDNVVAKAIITMLGFANSKAQGQFLKGSHESWKKWLENKVMNEVAKNAVSSSLIVYTNANKS